MKLKNIISIIIVAIVGVGFFVTTACATGKTSEIMENNGDVKVRLHTSEGDITLLLYGDTPRHRDNFIKRVEAGDYDGVLFHRVISDFMIQTGDPTSKNAPKGKALGAGDAAEMIDAEILFPTHYHHRGAIAAARTGDNVNPERRSSGSQFYIVTGTKFSDGQLDQMEHKAAMTHKQDVFNKLVAENRDSIMAMRRNRDQAGLNALQEKLVAQTEELTKDDTTFYTPEMREAYKTIGGTPHLDGQYTVYGRVIDGMDVVEKIEKAETDGRDRPLEDIKIISAEVVK
ncbi:MAG: peptidylprolyl isomerase [Duncaniella sp.]|nr:peptidylprolyl isomerase [Duncaniella sp.]